MVAGGLSGKTEGEDVPLSAADVDLASMTAAESEQWKKLRWVWCVKCGGGTINKVGWGHRKVHCEFVMSLKDAGKLEEAQREFLFIRRGGKVAQAVVARDKQLVEDSQCSEGLLASSAGAGAAEPYKLDFGKYNGRTIAALCDSEHEAKSGYIPWLFASKGKSTTSWYLDKLEHELRRSGRWDSICKQVLVLRPALHETWRADKEAMDESIKEGQTFPKDAVKLAKLRAEKAQRDGDEDLRDEANTSVVQVADKAPRRPHRSTAQVENAHCKYCGIRGHKMPTCPKLRDDLEQEALGDLGAPQCTELVGVDKQIAALTAHMKYTWPEQRSAYYDAKGKRVRLEQDICGHDIVRMNAFEMARFAQSCGVLDDLKGTRCDNPKCREQRSKHPKIGTSDGQGSSRLGPLTGREDTHEMRRSDVGYRCRWCRRAYTVYHGNPMFGKKTM